MDADQRFRDTIALPLYCEGDVPLIRNSNMLDLVLKHTRRKYGDFMNCSAPDVA